MTLQLYCTCWVSTNIPCTELDVVECLISRFHRDILREGVLRYRGKGGHWKAKGGGPHFDIGVCAVDRYVPNVTSKSECASGAVETLFQSVLGVVLFHFASLSTVVMPTDCLSECARVTQRHVHLVNNGIVDFQEGRLGLARVHRIAGYSY